MDEDHDLLLYTPADFPDLSSFPSSSDMPQSEEHGTRHSIDPTPSQLQSPSLHLHHQTVMAGSTTLPHQLEGQVADAQQPQSSDSLVAGQLHSLQGHHPATEIDYFLSNPQAGSAEPTMMEDTWRSNPQQVHSSISFTTSTSSGQTLIPCASQMTLPGSIAMTSSNFNLHPGMQYVQVPSMPEGNVLQNMPLYPGVLNPSSTFKPRLRWTDDLHDKFIDAVEKLGGYSRATPSAILKAMGVDRLELGHVKSHLQKYRTEKKRSKEKEEQEEGSKVPVRKRAKTEEHLDGWSSDAPVATTSDGQLPGDGRRTTNEALDLEAALKKQYELQQMLSDQLEAQKKLQSSLEQHTKYISCLMRSKPNSGDDNPGIHAETDPSVNLPRNN